MAGSAVGGARVSFNNSTYLEIANATQTGLNISGHNELYIDGWVKVGALTDDKTLVSMWSTGQEAYRVWFDATDNKLYLDINDGSSTTSVGTSSSLTANTWTNFKAYHNPVADLIGIALGTDEFNTSEHTTGINTTTADFVVFNEDSGAVTNHVDCYIDSIGIWSTIPSPTLQTYLYNSNSGRNYWDLPTDLTDNLVSFWDMEINIGIEHDMHSSNDLNPTSSGLRAAEGVTNYEGVQCAQFDSSTAEELQIANASFSPDIGIQDNHWYLRFWVLETSGGNSTNSPVGIYSGTSNRDFYVQIAGSNFYFFAWDTGDTVYYPGGMKDPRNGVRYLVELRHDPSENKIYIAFNNADWGLEDYTSASASISGGVQNGSGDFSIGNGQNVSGREFKGYISQMAIWRGSSSSYIPDRTLRNAMWNKGYGSQFSDLSTDDKTGLASWWPLSESSGNRADSQGDNTLVDTNTVTAYSAGIVADNNAPGQVTSLTATADGSDTIDLSWSAPASVGSWDIIGYKIERKIGAGSWATLVSQTGYIDTTYQDTGLDAETQYTYRVSAINHAGTGTASSEANDTTDAAPSSNSNMLVFWG